jgi:hypothetical protein
MGAAIIAVPDQGPRLFSFSKTHGPSAMDMVGVGLLLAAWLPIAALLWQRRGVLRRRRGELGVAAITAALLALTIGLDLGPIWLVPAAVLVVVQLLLVREACAREE